MRGDRKFRQNSITDAAIPRSDHLQKLTENTQREVSRQRHRFLAGQRALRCCNQRQSKAWIQISEHLFQGRMQKNQTEVRHHKERCQNSPYVRKLRQNQQILNWLDKRDSIDHTDNVSAQSVSQLICRLDQQEERRHRAAGQKNTWRQKN